MHLSTCHCDDRPKDEEIRRIAEAVVPRCHPVHDVVGDMVQEDSPICHTSEQVESEISAFRRERSENFHRYCTEAVTRGISSTDCSPAQRTSRLRRLEPAPSTSALRRGRSERS